MKKAKEFLTKKIDVKRLIYHTNTINKILILFYPLFLYWMIEYIKFHNISQYMHMFGMIAKYELRAIIVNYSIILLISLFFRSVLKNSFWSHLVTSFLLMTISAISFYKFQNTNQPLLFTDLFLYKDAMAITQFANFKGNGRMIIASILLAIFLVGEYIFLKQQQNHCGAKQPYGKKYRIALMIVSLLCLLFLCTNGTITKKWLVGPDIYEPIRTYYVRGTAAGFFMNIKDAYIHKPKGYTEQSIAQIKQQVAETMLQPEEAKHPDVIVVMSESFADITKLKKVTFHKDPLEPIRKWQTDYPSGDIVVPVLGGGTNVTEFEFLTGLNSQFIEAVISPFSQCIRNDMNSLVKQYKANGYRCIAIHPNDSRFYNRNLVYPYLGFEDFISFEDMTNAKEAGGHISDEELTSQIIQQYEKQKGQNQYIFAISMQNHMPYRENQYQDYDIEIQESNLTLEEKQVLQAYAQGLYDASCALDQLIQYFQTVEKPVIIAFFGDHLPYLDEDFSVYQKNGYFTIGENYVTNLQMHETPYILWSNYELKEEIFEKMSANTLGMQIAMASNITLDWYYQYIAEIQQQYPVITKGFTMDKKLNRLGQLPEDLRKKYELLQYDLLVKKKYIPIK